MGFSISPVETEDIDLLVRKVDVPAHQDGLLYRLMFPHSNHAKENEILWTIDGLLETVHREDENMFKACGEDGLPVGLIGWTTSPGTFAEGINDRHQNSSTVKSGPGHLKNKNSLTPPSLDVISWRCISKRLREERQRVLRSCQNDGICRKPEFNLAIIGVMSSAHLFPQESPSWQWIQVINDKELGLCLWIGFVIVWMKRN